MGMRGGQSPSPATCQDTHCSPGPSHPDYSQSRPRPPSCLWGCHGGGGGAAKHRCQSVYTECLEGGLASPTGALGPGRDPPSLQERSVSGQPPGVETIHSSQGAVEAGVGGSALTGSSLHLRTPPSGDQLLPLYFRGHSSDAPGTLRCEHTWTPGEAGTRAPVGRAGGRWGVAGDSCRAVLLAFSPGNPVPYGGALESLHGPPLTPRCVRGTLRVEQTLPQHRRMDSGWSGAPEGCEGGCPRRCCQAPRCTCPSFTLSSFQAVALIF